MTRFKWDKEAAAALQKAPRFVRPLVRRKVEERVTTAGGDRVSLADFQAAEARFQALRSGKTDAELEQMLPQSNKPGVEMVAINACQAGLANCPNLLINTDELTAKLTQRLEAGQFNDRLRRLVAEDRVLFHHKLKISISGCPNGCSRPQIADFGLLGGLRPIFDASACTGCGACAEVCPDAAIVMADDLPLWDSAACQGCLKCSQACPAECISLAEPFARLTCGGKLGRHPHLAEPVGEFPDFDAAVETIAQTIDDYLDAAAPGQRFADWRLCASKDDLKQMGGVQ